MASPSFPVHVNGSLHRNSVSPIFHHPKTSNFSSFKSLSKKLQLQVHFRFQVTKSVKNISERILNNLVESFFQFNDQPYLPSQSNFAPIEEVGNAITIGNVIGEIPVDFPTGVYIRNGPNPLFGGLKSTTSLLGKTSHTWFEGEGMLHALYFSKDNKEQWVVSYNNKYVQSETFKLEKRKNKPCFLPAIEGDSPAILAAYLLNMLRFGKNSKYISNTNIFNHSGKYYSIAENHIPQEIDISTLETLHNWDVGGAWNRPFTSHPKKAPGTGELVILGVDALKPFVVLGVISDDGKKLVHKVDLKFKRSSLCHELGVTEKYASEAANMVDD